MELFGFELSRTKSKAEPPVTPTPVIPTNVDGAQDVFGMPTGNTVRGQSELYNMEPVSPDEKELIKKYRDLSLQVEVDKAISEIVNDAISKDKTEPMPVKLHLDDIKLSAGIKKKINEEFETILWLMKFNRYGYDLFKNWYIDGRLYCHTNINKNKPKEGLKTIEFLDSLYIKKVREIEKDAEGMITNIESFYLYKPDEQLLGGQSTQMGNFSFGYGTQTMVRFPADSITYANSGILNKEKQWILSYLQTAIKTANQLTSLEDSVVIYRMVRAPERRIFYIDVGNLPKTKAEQYLNNIMQMYRNKVSYNSSTGEVIDAKNQMAMLEDYWLPRREGGRGTEIDTLDGGENLGEMDDILYFRKKLYESLHVPLGRLDNENSFNFGKNGEITREEIKFSKFIDRLREQFAHGLFSDILRKQLILKKIITDRDWLDIESRIIFAWTEDSHFAEMKELQLIMDRMEVVDAMGELSERFFSDGFIMRTVLKQDDLEQKALAKERAAEKKAREDDDEFGDNDWDKGISVEPPDVPVANIDPARVTADKGAPEVSATEDETDEEG